jgi:putative GTP pyrophosphokinase
VVALYTVNTIEGPREVQVEIQIRTMAMDFWATTEHSLQYKYKGAIPEKVGARLANAANAIIALDTEMSSVRDEIMDAQLSSKMKYKLVEDIVSMIENLYSLTSKREVEKIQNEFYRIYESDDMEELIHYHEQLDLIAQAYKAQCNRRGEGVKKSED